MIAWIQLIADGLHVVSYIILIKQILKHRSVSEEVSYRTQEMYLVVYLTRYGDILFNRFSFYLTMMKLLYIGITLYIIYLIRVKKPYKLGYDHRSDNLNHYLFLYPAAFIATDSHPFYEFCWSFSCWVEVVAIIPQISVIYKKKEVEVITGQYVVLIGAYKGMYFIKWLFHILLHKATYKFVIKFITSVLQVIVFGEFVYLFYNSQKLGGKMISIPV